jgi:thiol-disulfide isomerase/thioredoxin
VAGSLLTLVLLLAIAVHGEAAPAAPGFKVKLLDGKTSLDSHDLVGYCKPCAKEAPGLARVYDRYRARGVEVLAFHVQDTARDTRAFVRKYKVTYPVALDTKLTIGNPFGFKGSPYTVVIDRKGEMVAQIHGESAVTRLPRILDELLKNDPQPS